MIGRSFPVLSLAFCFALGLAARALPAGSGLARAVALPPSGDVAPPDHRAALDAYPQVLVAAEIPLDEPEIPNPMRGLYRWRGRDGQGMMVPAPAMDSYERFMWAELEDHNTPGAYDFAAIDRAIAASQANESRFGFRIRCYAPGTRLGIPEYVARQANGFYQAKREDKPHVADTGGDYVPDWNHPFFLERCEALLRALGERYGNHPSISFVDVGIYGTWGEWHMAGVPYPGPNGERPISRENAQRIVDWHVEAFPRPWVVMRVNNAHAREALERHPRLGCRADSVGNIPGFDRERQLSPWTRDRWKAAPMITETWNGRHPNTSVWNVAEHVVNYRVAMLGNGNLVFDLYPNPEDAPAEFLRAGKLAGYRFALDAVGAPTILDQNTRHELTAVWKNVGVTPAYNRWTILWQLRDGADRVAYEFESALNLMRFLPTPHGKPVTERFAIPGRVPPGSYTLAVQIRDPEGLLRPLALATRGRREDGSYPLGAVAVRATAQPADAYPAIQAEIRAYREEMERLQTREVEEYSDDVAVDLSAGFAAAEYRTILAGDTALVRAGNLSERNFADLDLLPIKHSYNAFLRQLLFRFPLDGLDPAAPVEQATVRLFAEAFDFPAGGVESACRPTDADWSEATVTYATMPAASGEEIGSWEAATATPIVEIDVTEFVRRAQRNGEPAISLLVYAKNRIGDLGEIRYAGRVFPEAGKRPRLIVRTK